VGFGGYMSKQADSGRTSLIDGPILFDRSLQTLLTGREYYPTRSNFLNRTWGAFVTPFATNSIAFFANLTWPRDKPWKDAGQDLFLSVSSLIANKGINDLFKGLVYRPRPYVHYDQETGNHRSTSNHSYDHHSFYSGHVSGSFCAVHYLNKRLRMIMSQRMSPDDYRVWRWAPPIVLYGWGAFVGWSRLHAYAHYPTDVIAGAVAGILFAELYYSFGDGDGAQRGASGSTPMMIRLDFSF
jgi:membrane-associated phospholipid phosphatase